MRRKRPITQLTPLELEIMKVLWELGSGTVQEVQHHLAPGRKLAYTTVQTMLNVLYRKGKVERVLQGRAHRYAACVQRRDESLRAVRDLLDRHFEGSAESLVMNLVETRQLTPRRLDALNRMLDQAEGAGDD